MPGLQTDRISFPSLAFRSYMNRTVFAQLFPLCTWWCLYWSWRPSFSVPCQKIRGEDSRQSFLRRPGKPAIIDHGCGHEGITGRGGIVSRPCGLTQTGFPRYGQQGRERRHGIENRKTDAATDGRGDQRVEPPPCTTGTILFTSAPLKSEAKI
jgi:hypothetical protein